MTDPKTYISLSHIPDEHFRGIGLVASASAFLEGAIERFIWSAARLTKKTGASITTHMGFQSRVDALCTLVTDQFPDSDAAAALPRFSDKLKKQIWPKRNEIVHNRVVGYEIGAPLMRTTYQARGKLKRDLKPVLLSEYQTVSQEILAAANRVMELKEEIEAIIQGRKGRRSP